MLGPIAHHFGVTVPAILAANPGLDANHLKIKAVINIPAGATPPATAPSARTSGSHGEATAAAAAPGSAKPGASYKIRKSDTLMTIARSAYGSEKDWKRIYNANKSEITDPNLVPVGLVIKIPQ
jgi:nucleoid-associated protein YgaU